MSKRSRLASIRKPDILVGFRMAYMAYARFSNLFGFRILLGIRCSVFESLLYKRSIKHVFFFMKQSKPFKNWTLKSLVLECFQYSDVWNLNPHCTVTSECRTRADFKYSEPPNTGLSGTVYIRKPDLSERSNGRLGHFLGLAFKRSGFQMVGTGHICPVIFFG